MSNYYGVSRTNYFKTKDVEKFKEILQNTATIDDDPPRFIDDGQGKVGFYCESPIIGIYKNEKDAENGEADFNLFLSKLQEIVDDDDAILFTEIGKEKMCYLIGNTIVITKNKINNVNLDRDGIKLAKEMLGNPNWNTQNEN